MPWQDLMAFGIGVLRLSSSDFWALSVREAAVAWRSVTGAGNDAPSRQDIHALMRAFPDAQG